MAKDNLTNISFSKPCFSFETSSQLHDTMSMILFQRRGVQGG